MVNDTSPKSRTTRRPSVNNVKLPAIGKAKGKAKAKSTQSSDEKKRNAKNDLTEDQACTIIRAAFDTYIAKNTVRELDRAVQAANYANALKKAEAEAVRTVDKHEARKKDALQIARERRRKLAKQFLNAAEMGDDDTVVHLLSTEGISPDVVDGNGCSAISNAANQGQHDMILLLLERQADPNATGEFERTPLWRAAFAHHIECVQVLLEGGANPNIPDRDGALPIHVATNDEVKKILGNVTEEQKICWAENLKHRRDKLKAAQKARLESKTKNIKLEMEELVEKAEIASQQLLEARHKLEERIKEERQTPVATSSVTPREMEAERSGYHRGIVAAAVAYDIALENANMANRRMVDCRLKLHDALNDCGEDPPPAPGHFAVRWRDLNDVIIKDRLRKISGGEAWPLIVDGEPGARASLFFEYSGCMYLKMWSTREMSPQSLRNSLLTAIARGLPLVLDIMAVRCGLEDISHPFNKLHPKLFSALMDKQNFCNQRELWLELAEGSEEWEKERFLDKDLSNRFVFIVLTGCIIPSEKLTPKFMLVHIIHPPVVENCEEDAPQQETLATAMRRASI